MGRDVVHDAHAVAQALGAGELERLPDRGQAERLAGVDRDVEVLAADVLEGVEVARRRIALLGPGHVEPDDAGIAPADGALGDLDRAGRLAHRGDQHLHDDRVAGLLGPGGAQLEALEIGGDDLVEGEAALGRELRGIADLGVDDAVGRQVLGTFGGDPDDRVALLHDADRVRERFEVELQALAVGTPAEPGGELVDVRGGQAVVAELRGQVDHRGRAEPTVEMVVQERLGRSNDGRQIRHGRSLRLRTGPMVPRRPRARTER